MSNLLVINASPRGDASAGNMAANIFLEALPESVALTRLDLFDAGLPEVTVEVTSAKMKYAMGLDLDEEEAKAMVCYYRAGRTICPSRQLSFCYP